MEAYINLGAAHKDLDELDTALWALRRAVKLRPASSDALYNAAQIHDQRGDHEAAMKGFALTLATFERTLQNHSSEALCKPDTAKASTCSDIPCEVGSWRIVHHGPCALPDVQCVEGTEASNHPSTTIPGLPAVLYGDPTGHR